MSHMNKNCKVFWRSLTGTLCETADLGLQLSDGGGGVSIWGLPGLPFCASAAGTCVSVGRIFTLESFTRMEITASNSGQAGLRGSYM